MEDDLLISGPDGHQCLGNPPIWLLRFTVDGRELWVQALPTLKYQFEAFATTTGDLDNAWYQASQIAPADNSPVPWRTGPSRLTADNYEGAFIGGLTADEALRFARQLHPRAGVPTLELWRKLYAHTRRRHDNLPDLLPEADREFGEFLAPLQSRLQPSTLAQAMLLEGGLLEWAELPVFEGSTWRLIGRPRRELLQLAFNPVTNPIEPQPGARIRAATVRIVLWGNGGQDGQDDGNGNGGQDDCNGYDNGNGGQDGQDNGGWTGSRKRQQRTG